MSKINYEKICKQLGINLKYEDNGFKDGGASTDDTIYLYPCSKKYMEELSFWHELGHILLNRTMTKRKHYL